jgi:hypothetical protein
MAKQGNGELGQRITIVLFDGVEELDAVGPWEVLAHRSQHYPEDGWTVSCQSPAGRRVTAAKGLVLGAHAALDDGPPPDVLLHPGGQGTRRLLADRAYLEWIRSQRAVVPIMRASVPDRSCTRPPASWPDARRRPLGARWRSCEPSMRRWRSGNTIDSWTMATSSPPPVSVQGSIWPSTWWTAWRGGIGPPGPARHPVRPAAPGLTL